MPALSRSPWTGDREWGPHGGLFSLEPARAHTACAAAWYLVIDRAWGPWRRGEDGEGS